MNASSVDSLDRAYATYRIPKIRRTAAVAPPAHHNAFRVDRFLTMKFTGLVLIDPAVYNLHLKVSKHLPEPKASDEVCQRGERTKQPKHASGFCAPPDGSSPRMDSTAPRPARSPTPHASTRR